MKYFSPSYWFKLWVLSIPLFSDKTQGINTTFPLERLIIDQHHRPGLRYFSLPGLDSANVKGYFNGNEIKELEIAIRQYEKTEASKNGEFGKKLILIKVDFGSKDGWIKEGDIYIGTDKGIYSFHNQEKIIEKYIAIKEGIKDIILSKIYSNVLILTNQDEIYDIDGKLVKKMQNIGSSDLEKELKIYFNGEKTIRHCSTLNNYHNEKKYIVNLGKINPIDSFNKLEFLSNIYAQTNWGSWVYNLNDRNPGNTRTITGNTMMEKRKNNFHDIIKNKYDKHEIFIQSFDDKYWGATVKSRQSFWLNWYWENGDYFFSITFRQYLEWWASASSLCGSIEVGKGIRLYKEYATKTQISRVKRDVFDISKLNEKKYNNKTIVTNELKNITKWTDDVTKSINQEKNLPAIINNTNYVTNNVTTGV